MHSEGTRIQDAIDAAGGLLAEADLASLNRAALLEDGQQLNIPYALGSEPVLIYTHARIAILAATSTPSANPDIDLIDLILKVLTLEELDFGRYWPNDRPENFGSSDCEWSLRGH